MQRGTEFSVALKPAKGSRETGRVAHFKVPGIVAAQHPQVAGHATGQHGCAAAHGFHDHMGAALGAAGVHQHMGALDALPRLPVRARAQPAVVGGSRFGGAGFGFEAGVECRAQMGDADRWCACQRCARIDQPRGLLQGARVLLFTKVTHHHRAQRMAQRVGLEQGHSCGGGLEDHQCLVPMVGRQVLQGVVLQHHDGLGRLQRALHSAGSRLIVAGQVPVQVGSGEHHGQASCAVLAVPGLDRRLGASGVQGDHGPRTQGQRPGLFLRPSRGLRPEPLCTTGGPHIHQDHRMLGGQVLRPALRRAPVPVVRFRPGRSDDDHHRFGQARIHAALSY